MADIGQALFFACLSPCWCISFLGKLQLQVSFSLKAPGARDENNSKYSE